MVLDTVAQIRKCGLESVLSLPQLVVCGDQSAGKSSVLEALAEIPFPRKDNLCTRFATEIILRRATCNSLTVKVIPDPERPGAEKDTIEAFNESITDFAELPSLMEKAMAVMGLDATFSAASTTRAFARDVLSIAIEGPTRPQLTLVDLPGLIQNDTKGVTPADVKLVREITDHYISQPRTICLAVVSAANDYANQGILSIVRGVDPEGDRTLGIITKPDRLDAGSESEQGYLSLARNEDVFFKLGWHVLKNRKFEERSYSFSERNVSEDAFFRTSNFKILPKDYVGISSLRTRLSKLLFNHVKQELPKLRVDLNEALEDAKTQLLALGSRRATTDECKAYMTQLSLDIYEVSKAAVDGHYEGDYFTRVVDKEFSIDSSATIRRLRAVVQYMNAMFSKRVRMVGHKYDFAYELTNDTSDDGLLDDDGGTSDVEDSKPPIFMNKSESMDWVGQALTRTRGRELQGNFNPLLVGELLWEQSSKWEVLATDHVECVSIVCSRFLRKLLEEKCPMDICSRLWPNHIEETLKLRAEAAAKELKLIMADVKSYPLNYNHYYTDTIKRRRQERATRLIQGAVDKTVDRVPAALVRSIDTIPNNLVSELKKHLAKPIVPDMDKHSCEEVLDCLNAIYKVSQFSFHSFPFLPIAPSVPQTLPFQDHQTK